MTTENNTITLYDLNEALDKKLSRRFMWVYVILGIGAGAFVALLIGVWAVVWQEAKSNNLQTTQIQQI